MDICDRQGNPIITWISTLETALGASCIKEETESASSATRFEMPSHDGDYYSLRLERGDRSLANRYRHVDDGLTPGNRVWGLRGLRGNRSMGNPPWFPLYYDDDNFRS